MYKKNFASRLFSLVVIVAMVFTMMPQGAFAASGDINVVKGTSEVSFGNSKAYDVTAEVGILDGKINQVTFGHNAKEAGHQDSVSYAENAKTISEKFIGKNVEDRSSIEGVEAISGATITSDAYKSAVLNALGYKEEVVDLTFGSANKELQPGTYKVPVSLRNEIRHEKPSNAAAAFPAMATLKVTEDGKAVITSDIHSVTIGPITDMAYDIKYYSEDGTDGTPSNVTVLEKMKKPEGMPEPGKEVPTKISFEVPNNHFDGIYMNFTVDAMGPASPDAWLQIDYANAKEPGKTKHLKGSAKVNQFGKYTIHTDVSVTDGVITNVDVTADSFISETHKPTNDLKIAQVTKALKSEWNGMAPTQENAENIFKKIMKKTAPDEVIDSISGATYSGKAVRDAVMNACGLEYQDEVINVPKSVEPGIYEVDVEYASDVVWHSLIENAKGKATLTVNNDKTMSLEMDLKSGTEKEPLYILGFNGVYPNNDRTEKLTKDGCEVKMGLSSNDYEDENFAKGTQVVNHVKFPLNGGLNKVYNTNAYLYVPAMKRLNGELSGVYFENGKFNVDIFAKIFWDGMKKIEDVPEVKPNPDDVKKATFSATMLHEYKETESMCNIMFDEKVDVTYANGMATMKLLVANPVPGFPEEGKDGTVKNVVINYDGKEYKAKSELNTGAKMTAKTTNSTFGFEAGKQYDAQVLTFTLPEAAVKDGVKLITNAYVNVVMNTDVVFRINLKDVKEVNKEPIKSIGLNNYFYKVNEETFRGAYNGNQMKAAPIVKNAKGEVLKAGVDYEVTYNNAKRVEVGAYTFTVKGIGDYTGETTCTLIITPKAVSNVNVRLGAYAGGYDDAYVTWNKSAGADGYYVYMRRPNIKNNAWVSLGTVKGNTLLKKNLYDGYKYEFKVLPYVKAGMNYKTTGNYKVADVQTLMRAKINTVKKYNNVRTRLTWTKVRGVTGYQVMVSAKGNTRYFTINSPAANAKVVRNAKTTFKVRAYKDVKNNSGKTIRVYAPWSDARTFTLR